MRQFHRALSGTDFQSKWFYLLILQGYVFSKHRAMEEKREV